MKKRILALALTFALILALIPASVPTASAYEAYEDWEYYEHFVSGYVGTAETVTVPSVINGIPIIHIFGSSEIPLSTTLKNITIPSSIERINPGALNNYRNLLNIYVDPDNPYYTSIDGILYSKDTKDILCFPSGRTGSFTVPDHVTTIGESKVFDLGYYSSTFEYSRLTSLTIPNGVTGIGTHAFRGSNLISITIPSSVTRIYTGYYDYGSSFEDCRSLVSINVDSAYPYFSSVDGVLYSENQTGLLHYPVGKPDNSFMIPDSVTNIEWYAFRDSNLVSVTFPSSLKYIGEGAFNDCKSLASVTILSSDLAICASTFTGCSSLDAVYFASTIPLTVDFRP